MIVSDPLENSLEALTRGGLKQLVLLQTDPAVQDYWNQRNAILTQMNQELEAAVNSITSKYQNELDAIEQEYAVYLCMITPDKTASQT